MRHLSTCVLVAAVTSAAACSASCGNTMPSTSPSSALAPDSPKGDADGGVAAYPSVVALPDGLPPAKVRVTLARTDPERQRGLMFVKSMAPDDGMLFIFDVDAVQSFWMKNTLIPLDMIFIRSDLTVVGVVANATPLRLDPQSVGLPSRFVLEVNGGWAAQHGVGAGTKVQLDGIPL